MIESNVVSLESPYYRRLTENQIHKIHDASLEILERTGIRFRRKRPWQFSASLELTSWMETAFTFRRGA